MTLPDYIKIKKQIICRGKETRIEIELPFLPLHTIKIKQKYNKIESITLDRCVERQRKGIKYLIKITHTQISGPSVAAGGNGQIKKEVLHKAVFDLTGACFPCPHIG